MAISNITQINGLLINAATASYTVSASYAAAAGTLLGSAASASYAGTASYLNALNQNVVITGSLTLTNNLTVFGSASITNISQSTLNIGTNLITVNSNAPSVRFGGLAVIDSGSSPQRSGSLLFDSTNDQWIFVHQNTAGAVTSSVLIQGPQTFNNIGNETNLTNNRLTKSVNAEHIGDSNISDTGTVVSINSNTQVTGSLYVSGSTTDAAYSFLVQNSSGQTLIGVQNNRTVNINSANGTNGGTTIGTTTGGITFNQGYNNTLIGNALTFYSGNNHSTIQGWSSPTSGIAVGYAQTNTNPNTGSVFTVKGAAETSGSGVLFVTGSSATRLLRVASETNANILVVSGSGNVGIRTTTPSYNLDVSGSGNFTNGLTVTGSLLVSGSSIITNALTVGTSSAGSTENTIVVGPPPAGGAGEGGQILLQASITGGYTSASMIDNYQNQFRVLRGTNAGSDAFKLSVNMHTGQVQIPNYNSPTAFTGSAVAGLGVDSNGNIVSSTRTARYGTALSGSTIGTGVTAQTIVYSQLIPANTWGADDIFRTYFRFRKLATNGNATYNILVNTSNAVAGATTLATLTANTVHNHMKRDFYIAQGGATTSVGSGVSSNSDDVSNTQTLSNITWTSDQYLIYTVTLNTLDSGYGLGYTIEQVL